MLQTKERPSPKVGANASIKQQYARLQLKNQCSQIRRQSLARSHPRLKFCVENYATEKLKPVDLQNYSYLIPIITDDSQIKVIKKPTQRGITLLLVLYIFEAITKGMSAFYVLPNHTLRNAIVQTRVNILLDNLYTDILMDKNEGNMHIKHFKEGNTLVSVGSNKPTDFVALPADMAIIDEYDFCDQKNVPLAKNRLDHSKHKIEIYNSTPTFKGKLIDQKYKDSDQKKWNLKCPHCGEWQILSFFGNVLRQGSSGWEPIDSGLGLHCGKCEGLMDRLANGEYVGIRKHRVSGYHIPALCSPNKSILEIYYNYLSAQKGGAFAMQWFTNNDLGEAYSGEGVNITQERLDMCKAVHSLERPNINTHDRCTMGIDVGNHFHIRISRLRDKKREAIYINKLLVNDEGVKEILGLIKRYRVRRGVIDSRPEMKLSKDISDLSNGVIWRCDYTTEDKPDMIYKIDKDVRLVKAHRTWSIDEMVGDVNRGNLILPRNAHTACKGEYYEQMQAPTKQIILGANGRPRYVWDEGSNPDHFFHAENYDKIAQMLLGAMYEGAIDKEDFQPALHDRGVNQYDEEFGEI